MEAAIEARRGFRIFNRVVNPIVSTILRSPLHPLLSARVALISVTGRRSGRVFTIPVGYSADGDAVVIRVGWPERKVWWRNLSERPSTVRLRIRGEDRSGRAELRDDARDGVSVQVQLSPRPPQ